MSVAELTETLLPEYKVFVAPYLPMSPSISLYLPISPYSSLQLLPEYKVLGSPYLTISPYISRRSSACSPT